MKKMICLLVIALMIASVALAAGKKITPKDLAGLKGTWEGILDFGMVGATSGSSPCTLEILNDTIPVQGRLTISNVPDFIASHLGIMAGRNVVESNDGVITSQGTLMWTGPQKNFVEVSLSADGKKLIGNYWFRMIKGSMSLKKK